MSQKDEKMNQLLEFLDHYAFDPIINKNENDFKTDEEKNIFRKVKNSTESEKTRFHNSYHSAQDIKKNYLSDLTSSSAKRIDPEIESLGLPILPQFREQFMNLCKKLDV